MVWHFGSRHAPSACTTVVGNQPENSRRDRTDALQIELNVRYLTLYMYLGRYTTLSSILVASSKLQFHGLKSSSELAGSL